jgi:short-subunit dehydrogenase
LHATRAGYRVNVAVVVVTGASAGVGRAVAHAFGARGDKVALVARDADRLDQAAKEVLAAGATEAIAIPVDVADWNGVDEAAARAERELGPIDIWVNDAMTSVFAPFWEIRPEEFRRVTEVTYLGFVHGTRAALSRMRPRDRGRIIQIGSALAYRGIPLQSAYCGAKHAIQGFTESVRTELMHEGSHVTMTMIQLPAVNTPQFDWVLSRLPRRAQPVPPIFEPEVIAAAVVHAAERYRREYWVGWSCIRAIVANRIMPGILDRVLARTGFDSQQTSEPAKPDRPANLWEPVPGDWGAHGRFDDRAKKTSTAARLARARDRALDDSGASRVLDAFADRVAALIAREA